MIVALGAVLASGSTFAGEPQTLGFDWTPGMRCAVEQTLVTDDPKIGTQQSRLEIEIKANLTDLIVRFTAFEMTALSVSDTPETHAQGNAMGRAVVEREFFVSKAGAFLRAEPVKRVRERLRDVKPQGTLGRLTLAMLAVEDQRDLEKDYAAEWRLMAGAWIGLATNPDRQQYVRLGSDGPFDVNVSAPRTCTDDTSARCVTLVAVTPEGDQKSWWGERIELESEPDSLIPHRWMQESWG